MAEAATGAAVVLPGRGVVRGWARGAEDLPGYPAPEAVGRPAAHRAAMPTVGESVVGGFPAGGGDGPGAALRLGGVPAAARTPDRHPRRAEAEGPGDRGPGHRLAEDVGGSWSGPEPAATGST
ncbi:hypothetical protein ABZ923_21655 [Streptomyces sp. NPDC046881]|uniref:hypothetical protein n=1 Tax=Streptomyces sp. NPDC046881 TaxID=3155374 RepID=UPI00340B18CB